MSKIELDAFTPTHDGDELFRVINKLGINMDNLKLLGIEFKSGSMKGAVLKTVKLDPLKNNEYLLQDIEIDFTLDDFLRMID
jgi:hypothetical protein